MITDHEQGTHTKEEDLNGRAFTGFDDPQDAKELVRLVLEDPPEARWRAGRVISRCEIPSVRGEVYDLLNQALEDPGTDIRLAYRITLALRLLQRPLPPKDIVIRRGQGACYRDKMIRDDAFLAGEKTGRGHVEEIPVIDMHVHPKEPDGPLLTELLEAGVKHAAILATDTDPVALENKAVLERIRRNYEGSDVAEKMSFDEVMQQIGDSLYSPGHVTNQDILDWIADYPETLIGFGSVDLSRGAAYVEKTLEMLSRAPQRIRGIKLLPFSQFFDPAANENIDLLMSYCRKNRWIVLTHTGLAAGVFEDPQMNRDSRPSLWEGPASRYPDVPIILAHMGAYGRIHRGYWFEDALETMRKHENVYADTAAAWGTFFDEENVEKIRKRTGMDRILFGTDYPASKVMPGGIGGVIRCYLTNLWLTDAEKEKILYHNAAGLMQLQS